METTDTVLLSAVRLNFNKVQSTTSKQKEMQSMYQILINNFRMASAVSVLSREETNFLRVANLLIRLSHMAVRILFDREFYPNGLKSIF